MAQQQNISVRDFNQRSELNTRPAWNVCWTMPSGRRVASSWRGTEASATTLARQQMENGRANVFVQRGWFAGSLS